MADSQEVFDRSDDQSDRLTSLYGLTPKVESAIIDAVQSGAVHLSLIHISEPTRPY